MRAMAVGIVILAGCVRSNPNLVDTLAAADAAVPATDDLGNPDDLAPLPDMSGPRIVFAPTCGGVSGSVFSLSGMAFILNLRIVDGANQTVDTDAAVMLAIEAADPSTTLTGGGSIAATHGNVTFSASLDHWSAGKLIATSPGVAPLEIPFVVHGGNASFLTQPSDTVAAQTMTPAVQVVVTDITGSPDASIARMSLGLTGCGHSPSSVIATASTSGGVATFDQLAIGPACDSYQLQLTLDFYYGTPLLSTPFKVVKGPPVRVVLSTGTAFVTRRQPFTVVASIEDAGGNVVDSLAPTQVSLALSGATLGGTTTQTTSGGVATFGGLVVDPAGFYTLTGHADGLQDGTLSLHVSAWELRTSSGAAGVAVAIDDPDTVYAWNSQHSLVSHDGAVTWSVLLQYPFAGPIVPDPTDATTLWTVGGAELQRSTDRGSTWQPLVGPSNFEFAAVRIGKGSPHTLLAYGNNESLAGPTPGTWISTDGGATWHPGGPMLASGDGFLDALIADDGTMYVSAGQYTATLPSGFLARSVDNGVTWTKLPGVPVLRDLAADAFTPTTIFASRLIDNFFARSNDRGTTWTLGSDSSTGGLVVPHPGLQGHYLRAPGSIYGVLLSTDGCQTWTSSFDAHDTAHAYADGIAFAPSNPSIVYLAVDDGILRSVTGGE